MSPYRNRPPNIDYNQTPLDPMYAFIGLCLLLSLPVIRMALES